MCSGAFSAPRSILVFWMELIGHSVPLDWRGVLMVWGLTGFWGGVKRQQKRKYRNLSTAAARCAAFGRDDVLFLVDEGRTGGGNSWVAGIYVPTHRKCAMHGVPPRRFLVGEGSTGNDKGTATGHTHMQNAGVLRSAQNDNVKKQGQQWRQFWRLVSWEDWRRG
jgi:hypothetical protein